VTSTSLAGTAFYCRLVNTFFTNNNICSTFQKLFVPGYWECSTGNQRHHIAEILLKVALNTIPLTLILIKGDLIDQNCFAVRFILMTYAIKVYPDRGGLGVFLVIITISIFSAMPCSFLYV
jgi:hypothetical protein